MKNFIVSYDANKEMDYPCLYTVLQGYSTVVHCTESTWVVEADSIDRPLSEFEAMLD